MYQNTLNNFNTIAKNIQYNENYEPIQLGSNRQGLIRSASTSCAVINTDQPRVPPRRKKRGQSLSSNKLSSANSSQYSLVMNYTYAEMDPNAMNTSAIKQNAWTPNATLRRYMSSDMAGNYNQYNQMDMTNNFTEQFQKPIGVLEQVINRTIPTPPPRLSSVKNTLRRRSYVESLVNNIEPPVKPIRQKLQSGLNQSQFDIPGTPITTHLPPQALNRFNNKTLARPSTNLSSINLSQQPSNLPLNNQSNGKQNLDYQIQPFYNKTMSLDNLNAVALRQTLRRSPTREELFDFIVQQQEQLSEIKTQQKVLEKQVDLAHKEATKAHHHHHHHKNHHRHHKTRSKDRDNLDNSIDSSSMISSDRKNDRRHHKSTKVDKNLTAEANKQVHDHIRQLQEQLELIRQKRRKIRTDKNADPDLDQLDQVLDKSIDQSFLYNINRKLNAKDSVKDANPINNSNNKQTQNSGSNPLLKPPGGRYREKEQMFKNANLGKEGNNNLNINSNLDDLHGNLLSPIPTPQSNISPLGSRSSSIERALTKRELLKESAKEKWNRSFMEDLSDEQLVKELSRNPGNEDLLKELLPKISVNQDDKNNYLSYNEILEKNLKLNQAKSWLTDSLEEHTYGEKSPTNEPLSPFGGRTGVFKPINTDQNKSNQYQQTKLDLLTGADKSYSPNFTFPMPNRNETRSPQPPNYQTDNIEGNMIKKENNLITGNIDLLNANSMQQDALFKKQEDKLIERLENELKNEKLKQNELFAKKQEIEQKQIEHELELEKTRSHLIEQQNLFQEQQQQLQNQRQEIQIERWRMEQEKQQLMHQHEMNIKKEQLEQQQVLNQQLEQQRRNFEQQLQNQKLMQQQLQNELEHQKQLQIKSQQKQQQLMLDNQNAILKQQEASRVFNEQHSNLVQNLMNQTPNINTNQQQPQQLQQQLQLPQQSPQQLQLAQQLQQLQSQSQPQATSSKKFHLNSPLQSLQSLLPQSLQTKSFQAQQLQQTSQSNLNEPSKQPRRHRLGQDDSAFSAFKPPMHSNSKSNIIDSPKNSFFSINLTSPAIATEQQRPASPRPPFTSNPGLLSSNSSLTRRQPVGVSSFANQQINRHSNENVNRTNFYGSYEMLDQANKSNQQYFGSGGNLNKAEMMNNNLGNLNNLNRSTGSIHQQDRFLAPGQSPQMQRSSPKLGRRSQFRAGTGTGNYQLDHYDQTSSHTNLNGPRRNSAMDPFRDHFDQYFTPKKQTSTTNLRQNSKLKASNIDLTKINVESTNLNLNGSSNNLEISPTANKIELRNQNPLQQTVKDALVLHPFDKLVSKDNSLSEYQGLGNRRLTLPELPRVVADASKEIEQIKGYAINKVQPKDDFSMGSVVKRKNSLPDNVKSAAAVIKPGWDREEVSHLAHEAREAKVKAAEMNTTRVTMLKFRDWLISNLFLISLIVFNLSIFYVYLQFIEPLEE